MRICFVLPRYSRNIIGGYKMVFEYANRLSNQGDDIGIVFINENILPTFRIPKIFKRLIATYLTEKEPRWFKLNKQIKKYSGISVNYTDFDAVFATGVDTVAFVESHFTNTRKLYLIQDFESWVYDELIITKSFQKDFEMIVISSWLEKKVEECTNRKPILIQNPIDEEVYTLKENITNRIPHTIGLLYHEGQHKGVDYALAAIYKLKKKYPDLNVYMFGVPVRPTSLPGYFHYSEKATQEETVSIYNRVSVFLCATIEEGWGLTGLEAMACGAVLVSTSYRGVHEYAIDKRNSLLSPIKDVDSLVENVSNVFENNSLRISLSNQGVKDAKNYSWAKALKQMNAVLRGLDE